MKCRNCQNEIENGIKFCPYCGSAVEDVVENATLEEAVEQEAVVETVPEEIVEEATEEIIEAPTEVPVVEAQPVAEPVAEAPAAEAVPVQTEAEAPKKTSGGKKAVGAAVGIIIAIVAVIVVAILAVVGFKVFSGGTKTIELENYPVFYLVDDEESKYIVNGKKAGYNLTDEDLGELNITEDGKYLFFTEEDGDEYDLYCRKISDKNEEDNVLVARGIDYFCISPDGSTVYYIKNDDLYKCGRNGKDPVKMGKDVDYDFTIFDDYKAVLYTNDDGEIVVSKGVDKLHKVLMEIGEDNYLYNIRFSEDEKSVVFTIEDLNKNLYTIYTCGTGKNDTPVKIESKIDHIAFIEDYGKEFYYVKNDDLYYKNGNKQPVEVEGYVYDVCDLDYTYDDDGNVHVYITTAKEKDDYSTEYNLYHIDGKNAKLMVEDFGKSYYYGSKVVTKSEYNDGDYDYTYYFRKDYDELVEIDIPEEDGEPVRYYAMDEAFYTLENVDEDDDKGELVRYKYAKDGINFNSREVVDEGVETLNSYSYFDETFYMIKYDEEDFAYYKDGKKPVAITDDFYKIEWIGKDGTIILAVDYNDSHDSYSLAKFDGKKTTIIAEDVVSNVILSKDLIYYIDDEENLFVNKGNRNKETLIDSDVSAMVDSRYAISLDYSKAFEYSGYTVYNY